MSFRNEHDSPRGGDGCDRSKRCCRGSALSVTTDYLRLVRRGVSAARGTCTAQVSSNVMCPSSKPPGPSSSVLFVRIECAGEAIGMMPPLCVPALRKYESMYGVS